MATEIHTANQGRGDSYAAGAWQERRRQGPELGVAPTYLQTKFHISTVIIVLDSLKNTKKFMVVFWYGPGWTEEGTFALKRDGHGVAGLGQRDGECPVDRQTERHVAGEDEAGAARARVHHRRHRPAAFRRRRRPSPVVAVGDVAQARREAGDKRRRARRSHGLPGHRRRRGQGQ